MVEINRVWINVDTDTNKIILFGRPRVSIRVDEYIWSLSRFYQERTRWRVPQRLQSPHGDTIRLRCPA